MTEERLSGLVKAVQGLTLANVLVIACLAAVAAPMLILWTALKDEKVMDRLLSTFEEMDNQQVGCTLRHVQARGGPDQWAISSGFAFAGADRYTVSVILTHDPGDDELVSYCQALKLIADRLNEPCGSC